MEFEVNDRILCIRQFMNNKSIVGQTGTIKTKKIIKGNFIYDVEFDEDIDGHDACGKYGYCWSFTISNPEEYFKLINSNLVELI